MFPVAAMCRVLGVSCSGFYAWRTRPPSARAVRDAALTVQIKASHARSDGTYGAPRIVEDLREAGEQVGQKYVARLMCEAAIVGVHRRRGVRTTRRGADEVTASDLVQRDFTAPAPNQLWVADITYVPTWGAFSFSLSCSMRAVAASSGGRWQRTCAPP